MTYKKDLTILTTFRLSLILKDDAEHEAKRLNISFSDFIRQSILRNVQSTINNKSSHSKFNEYQNDIR